MKENENNNATVTEPKWRGYSIDELRYRRAFTMARLEIAKERLTTTSRRLYGGYGMPATSGIVGKLFGSLNYVDYAVLAFRLGKIVYSLFRH